MKKTGNLFAFLLTICLLFTGCSPAFDVAGEPIADDPTQKFNTPNQFLPITLPTKSGGTCEAVVKVEITYDPDNEEALMQEVLADEVNVIDQSPEWEADQMRIVRVKVLVMPWGDTDFTEDLPEFSVIFGGYADGEGSGGGSDGPDEDPAKPEQARVKRDTPLNYSKLFRAKAEGAYADPGDRWCPFCFYHSPMTLIESDKPYYEMGIHAVLPKEEYASDDFEYVLAVFNIDHIKGFATMTFSDIPTEGKYVWKLM